MEIAKPSEDDKDYFTSLFGDHPALEVKAMFGNLAARVLANEQMCAGLFGPAVGLRLSESDRAELMAVSGAAPFGPTDRPMKEYVSVPPSWRVDDPEMIDGWIDRAIDYTSSLPAKKKKPKTKKPKTKQSENKKATN